MSKVSSFSDKCPLIFRASRYEVAWSDWKRLDGTNTTWMPNLYDRPDLVKSWKQKQNRRRRELAEESLDIEVQNYIDVHNANTFRKAQALLEKTDKRRLRPIRYDQWDIELDENLVDRDINPETDSWSRHLRKSTVRTDEPRTRLPSILSASPSVSSDKDTSSSRMIKLQTPSFSRSATFSSLTAPMPVAESRSVRALPSRAKLRSSPKALPSR